MKEQYKDPEVEIYDDEGPALRLAAETRQNRVITLFADAKRLSLDALAGIREHPRGAAEIGAAGVTLGLAAGGLTIRTLHNRDS